MSEIFAFDTETYPIHIQGKASNDVVPRLVCLSYATPEQPDGVLLDRSDGIARFISAVEQGALLIGANLPFDLNVMLRAVREDRPEQYDRLFEQVFRAHKFDVQMAARLEDIARGGMFLRGGYSLSQLEQRYLDVDRSEQKHGVNVWRLRYNELEGVAVSDYPADAYQYAIEDATGTLRLYDVLHKARNAQGVRIRSHYDWLLSLASSWGILVDQTWTAHLADFYEAEREKHRTTLAAAGIFDPKTGKKSQKATRDLFEQAFTSIGVPPPRTATGAVATNKAALNELEDAGASTPVFEAYAQFNRSDKFLSTYIRPLLDAGNLPLCPRFNALVDSGRTSSSGPNVQNFPSRRSAADNMRLAQLAEDGDEEMRDELRVALGCITGPDIRGALIPRPGHVFVAADYSAIEMAGVAQCARNITGELGTLGQAINSGLDLHCYVGAVLAGASYQEFCDLVDDGDKAAKNYRNLAKVANFGGWGGAGAQALARFARGMGIVVTEYQAEQALNAAGDAWSERDPYFRFVESQKRHTGMYYIEQHGPDRMTRGWRIRVTRRAPQALNTLFQGIVADGALWSLNLLAQDIYGITEESDALHGSRVVLFVHDEFVLETPAEKADAAAARLVELMERGMKRFLPDLKVVATPDIMEDRWAK